MESLEIAIAKLTGNPDSSGWCQVHDFTPEATEKVLARGRLIAVISTTKVEAGLDEALTGREILSRLHEEYFGNLGLTTFNALKTALEKVSADKSFGDVKITAAVWTGKVLYVGASGGGKVVIIRGGGFATLLESQEGTCVCASGYPAANDVYLLSTTRFFSEFSQGFLKARVENATPDKCVEALAPSLHAAKDAGSLGVAVLKFYTPPDFSRETSVQKTEEPAPVVFPKPSLGIRVKLAGLIDRISEKIPDPNIYLRQESDEQGTRTKGTTLLVGMGLLILLIISIGFGINQRNVASRNKEIEEKLASAYQDFEDAKRVLTSDPAASRTLFLSASEKVNLLLSTPGTKNNSSLTQLKEKLDSAQGEILGEYGTTPSLFVDLSLLSSGFNGSSVAVSEGVIAILDAKGAKAVTVDFASRKAKVVAGPDTLKDPLKVGIYAGRIFILNNAGIDEVGAKVVQVVKKDWGEALFAAYTGNLYLLDKSANKILRFSASADGFASGSEWLAKDVQPDFSKVVSLAIDGSLWIASESGKILKFAQGSSQAFVPTGVPGDLKSIRAIYTNEEQEYLYVLDSANSRIIVFDKQGLFKLQYRADELKNAIGLVVDEKLKKMVILTGDKLQQIDLK